MKAIPSYDSGHSGWPKVIVPMPQGGPEGAFIRAPGRVVDSVCNLIVGAAGRVTMAVLLREGLRYASDVTEAEWTVVQSHLSAAKVLGRSRKVE
jgi:hypothetical protein